jgi:hypothetical protein
MFCCGIPKITHVIFIMAKHEVVLSASKILCCHGNENIDYGLLVCEATWSCKLLQSARYLHGLTYQNTKIDILSPLNLRRLNSDFRVGVSTDLLTLSSQSECRATCPYVLQRNQRLKRKLLCFSFRSHTGNRTAEEQWPNT